MNRKGLSIDEKRARLLKALLDKSEFYTLKEIEKIGVGVGIVFQSVKEVLMSLVDDDLVKSEKVGAQTLFWALKSDALVTRQNKLDSLRKRVEQLREEKKTLESQIGVFEESCEDENRNRKLRELNDLKEAFKHCERRLETRRVTNAANIGTVVKQNEAAAGAVIRWSDNICLVKQWVCQRKPGVTEADVDKHFGIPPDI